MVLPHEDASMCVRTILDASAFGHFCSRTKNSAGDQLRKWIGRRDGVIVYSTYGKYNEELSKYSEIYKLLAGLVDRGSAIDVNRTDFRVALKRIRSNTHCKSNDPHILALAIAGKATVLFSCDEDLCKDFANVKVIPKVGRQERRSVPGLVDEAPNDITKAGERKKFLNTRRCIFC